MSWNRCVFGGSDNVTEKQIEKSECQARDRQEASIEETYKKIDSTQLKLDDAVK